jgi:HK97 family phage major capsid protein/HK97 family phage prohead protease
MTQNRLNISEIIGKEQIRNVTLERGIAANEDERSVELSFSSDAPIEHWFGKLILDHSPECCDLSRLANAGALLCDHNHRDQIGVIENPYLEKGKGRATVRFSRSTRGDEIFEDVKDGIRRNISVGFMIHEMRLETESDTESVYRATKWEPYEISVVSVPADTGVGIGRATDNLNKPNNLNLTNQTELKKVEENETAVVATTADETRILNEFTALGNFYGDLELARTYHAQNKSIADFKKAIADKRSAEQIFVPPTVPENNPQSLARIEPRVKTRVFKDSKTAFRFGQFIKAAMFNEPAARNYCRDNGITRAHNSAANAVGGALIPVEFEPYIVDLREQYGVFRRFAQVMPMASDSKKYLRRESGLTAYFLGAGDDRQATESAMGWSNLELTARLLAVLVKWNRETADDSIIALADTFMAEMAYAFSQKEDDCGFNGTGASTYGGIVGVIPKLTGLSGTIANIAGLQVASGNAWSEITLTDFHGVTGKLPQYADTPNARWFCHKTFYETVMNKLKTAAGGNSATDLEGRRMREFLGYPVEISQVMPKTEANSQVPCILGDLSLAATLGDRQGIELTTTDSDGDDFKKLRNSLLGVERVDINIHSVGNASATAADRQPGPVVGLITAAS